MSKPGVISLSRAARQLGEPVAFVRGLISGLGIEPEWVGSARVLRPEQYQKVRAAAARYKRTVGKPSIT